MKSKNYLTAALHALVLPHNALEPSFKVSEVPSKLRHFGSSTTLCLKERNACTQIWPQSLLSARPALSNDPVVTENENENRALLHQASTRHAANQLILFN